MHVIISFCCYWGLSGYYYISLDTNSFSGISTKVALVFYYSLFCLCVCVCVCACHISNNVKVVERLSCYIYIIIPLQWCKWLVKWQTAVWWGLCNILRCKERNRGKKERKGTGEKKPCFYNLCLCVLPMQEDLHSMKAFRYQILGCNLLPVFTWCLMWCSWASNWAPRLQTDVSHFSPLNDCLDLSVNKVQDKTCVHVFWRIQRKDETSAWRIFETCVSLQYSVFQMLEGMHLPVRPPAIS